MPDDMLAQIAALLGDRGPDKPRTSPDVLGAIEMIRRLQARKGAPRAVNSGDASGIVLTPGVSAFDGSGYVTAAWGDQRGQLTPKEARKFGQAAFEVAEEAEADAALLAFARTTLNADLEGAAAILAAVREHRHRDDT